MLVKKPVSFTWKVLLISDDVSCLGTTSRWQRSTFQVKSSTGLFPCVGVDAAGGGVVSHAGGVALVLRVGSDFAVRG